ncbi:TetR family transcriptional regulator [Micromonospora sp. WMMD812]|uniref:TetR family transcriptional regulator n=1 Tax=Micromonospora sp. WMMD812 TaxID=3015152 RepID=UPI00248D16B3|nr:TetR family transcriptional regulator [Micromonospora sp. WMMD812]WBB69066.1 TetR family transcriptional regulator [Micromonospora sp. WMMD812]
MVRDAEATRRRLLDAAADEFSEFGIAGARVDRIATASKSNKAQIYHYFGSKERLFDAVMNDIVGRTAGSVPITVDDLPGYAGRLFDAYEDDPRIARLATWYRLERPSDPTQLEVLSETIKDELRQIRAAQKAGVLPSRYRPADLLNLVLHMTFLWAFVFPELQGQFSKTARSHRRRVLVDAVKALLRPEPESAGRPTPLADDHQDDAPSPR